MSKSSDKPKKLGIHSYDEASKSVNTNQNVNSRSTILLATAGAACCAAPLIVVGVISFPGLGLVAGGITLITTLFYALRRVIGLK